MHGLKWTGSVGSCSHPFEVCFRVILFDGDEEQDEERRGDSDRACSLSSSFRNKESLPGLPVVRKSCCGFDAVDVLPVRLAGTTAKSKRPKSAATTKASNNGKRALPAAIYTAEMDLCA